MYFRRLHIPSGRTSSESFERYHDPMFDSDEKVLSIAQLRKAHELLNKWNGQHPGVWQYWM